MLALAALWGTPYVMSAYGLPRPEAAFYVSLMLFGWAIGAPFSGWLSDRLQQRKVMLVWGSAVLTVILGLISFVPGLPLFATIALMACGGLAGSTMVTTFALGRETSPAAMGGSVTGIGNAMTVASGAVLQPVVGVILDLLWDGTMQDGSPVYQPETYQSAFSVVFVTSLAGFLLSLTLREKVV